MRIVLLPAIAAAFLAASLAPAAATAAESPPALRSVAIAPGELATPAGAAAVHERIVRAAIAACREENRHGAASPRSLRLCAEDAVGRAVIASHSAALADHHRGEAGRSALASLAASDAS